MPIKARYLVAAMSDGLFIASVGVGTVALLLEDTSAALRALALNDLPSADITWSAAVGESLGSVLFDGCGPDCFDEDCNSDCGSDCCIDRKLDVA